MCNLKSPNGESVQSGFGRRPPSLPAARAKQAPGCKAWTSAQAGFTLFEVLIAVAVLAIALTAIYRLHNQSIFLNRVNLFYSQAPMLARQRLAQLENRPMKKWSDDSGDFEDEFEGYHWQISVEQVPLDLFSSKDYKFYKITVTINDSDQQKYSFDTYRFVVR